MNPRSRKPAPRRSAVRTKVRATVADAILDAAEAVASEHGVAAATAAAIAQRAGVAVGTLYNYFPDRDGIFAALFVAKRAALGPRITAAAAAAAGLPFAARLRALVDGVLAIFDQERRFVRLAINADQGLAKAKGSNSTLVPLMEQAFDDVMRAGAAAKHFPAAVAPAHARMVLGSVKALALWRITNGQPMAGDGALLCDAWLHGVERS